jgi:hypothetical protein
LKFSSASSWSWEWINVTCRNCLRKKTDPPEILIERIPTLFKAIKHGDKKHQAWLKKAIEDHFAGRPVKREDR